MSDSFDFEEGDTVLVRIRNGTRGKLKAKFLADVQGFTTSGHDSDTVVLDPPWDAIGMVRLYSYDADFEVIEDETEVRF